MGWFLTGVQLRRAWLVSTDGISLATWCTFIYATIFWGWYGLAVHDVVVLWSSIVIFPIQAAIIAKIEKRGEARTMLMAGLFVFVTCGLPTIIWGWSAGCYGAGVLMVLNRWPQIKALVSSSEVEGVSVASWSIGTVSLALWVIYYSQHNKWAPLIASGGAGLGNLVIVALATWRHRQHRLAHPKESVGPLAG
jgi:uncharacterized protein with PQ loop repeat